MGKPTQGRGSPPQKGLKGNAGYPAITKENKVRIFGLNAAKLFGVDVDATRKAFPDDALTKLRAEYLDQGGGPSNTPNAFTPQPPGLQGNTGALVRWSGRLPEDFPSWLGPAASALGSTTKI